jgi:hypothetical protein
VDLLERQGRERESEVLKLKEEVRNLRQHNAELLDKLQPPSRRERTLVARLNSLAEYAQALQRELLHGPGPAPRAGNGEQAAAPPGAAPVVPPAPSPPAAPFRRRAPTPAPIPPAVVWGARWEPAGAVTEQRVWLCAHAPGFMDGTGAKLDVRDRDGDRTEVFETEIDAEEIAFEWLTPRLGGSYTFRVEVGGKVATAGWLEVSARPEGEVPDDAPAYPAPRVLDLVEALDDPQPAEAAAPGAATRAAPPDEGGREGPPLADRADGARRGEARPALPDEGGREGPPLDDEITSESRVPGTAEGESGGAEPPTLAAFDLPSGFARAPAAPAPAAPPPATDPPTHIFDLPPPAAVASPDGVDRDGTHVLVPRDCARCHVPLALGGRFCEKCGFDNGPPPPPT